MSISDIKCAPVMITTLSRKSYLERALISLSKNSYAKYTDLFISVDYPPSEKYEEGYRQVCEFLKEFDFSSFKSVEVTYQRRNLGGTGNAFFLENKVRKVSDKIITSEEDNEFAPCFLEYMNKMLDKYQDDKRVLAICGASTGEKFDNESEYIFSKAYSPYGVGLWESKMELLRTKGQDYVLNPKNWSTEKMKMFRRKSRIFSGKYICDVLCKDYGLFWLDNKTLAWVDSMFTIFMYMTDCVCVLPRIAKSRTWGNDGKGHSGMKQVIFPDLDVRDSFEIDDTVGPMVKVENYKCVEDFLIAMGIPEKRIQSVVYYRLLKIFGRKRMVRFLKTVRKIVKGNTEN